MESLNRQVASRWVGSRVVAIVLGLVLLTAGVLKARQWSDDPYAPGDLPAVPALRAAVANAEVALGLWLLSGIYPRAARVIAVGCFAVFLAVATRDSLENKASCGCFGSLAVPPWLTAIFDFVALACLVGFAAPQRATSRRLTSLAIAVFLAASVLVTWAIVGATHHPRLTPAPAVVDLGVIHPGAVSRSGFALSNTGTTAVEVTSVVTSCPCVEVRLPTGAIPPEQTVAGEVVLDTNIKPGFIGGLSVSVTGVDPAGRIVFTLTVEAVVREPGR
jgi:uncharacterized membrane protein YphA (DoxX/SURF4 family)